MLVFLYPKKKKKKKKKRKKRERESEFKLNYGGSSKVFIREFKRHFIKISYEK